MRKFVLSMAVLVMVATTAHAETIKVGVNGLVCSFCARGIEKTFKAQPTIDSVHVDLESKLVTLLTKANQQLDDATITKLITNAGYSITTISRGK